MNQLDRGAIVIGALFIGAGVLFLLEALDVTAIEPGVLWPVLVIGFGIGIAFGGRPGAPEDEPDPTESPFPPYDFE